MVAISWVYFFALLCSTSMLRPVRDEIGVRSGTDRLPWLFTGTFLVMLLTVPAFGWAASRWSPRRLVPIISGFFLSNLLLFYVILSGFERVAAPAFFIWLSVFNVFVVSIFWSFMSELCGELDARRRFGTIATAGSAGAIAGPALAALLASRMDPRHLLIIAAFFLAIAMCCSLILVRSFHRSDFPSVQRSEPLLARLLDGVRITARTPLLHGVASLVICYTMLGTILYVSQNELVANAMSGPGERTAYFARVDLTVNLLALSVQLFLTRRVLMRGGVTAALATVPCLAAAGFALFARLPLLPVVMSLVIVLRAGNFSLTRPAREVLFTRVDQPTRYQAKNFIDTTVFRSSDVVAIWVVSSLRVHGDALLAATGVAIAVLWFVTAVMVGRKHDGTLEEKAA